MKVCKTSVKIEKGLKVKSYRFCGIPFLKKKTGPGLKDTFLFNVLVSRRKRDIGIVNSLNLREVFMSQDSAVMVSPIDIVIIVHNDCDFLSKLFTDIEDDTDLAYRLIVCDDASDDGRTLAFLEQKKNKLREKMVLLRNESRLDLTETVNKCLRETVNHVVLLNSHARLCKNWASRLLRPIFANNKVASVIPFSKNVFLSFFNDFQDNISNTDDEYDNNGFLSRLNVSFVNRYFPIETAFCVAINKNAITEIGKFAKQTEKKAGWREMAEIAGYVNLIIGDAVMSCNGDIPVSIASADIQNDDYQSMRFIAELLFLNALVPETQVWFDHNWKGGTEAYTLRQFSELQKEKLCIRLCGLDCDYVKMSYNYRRYSRSLIFSGDAATFLLSRLCCELIVVNNMASYAAPLAMVDWIKSLKAEKKAKVSVRCHDFQYICPNINMINPSGIYCGCSNPSDCEKCFPLLPNPLIPTTSIIEWQRIWYGFLQDTADEILVFSRSSYDIFTKFYPLIAEKIKIIPHTVPAMRKVSVPKHKTINIVVLGAINGLKGGKIVKAIDGIIKKFPDIKMYIAGSYKGRLGNVHVVGRYDLQNLPDVLEKLECDIVFIPSIWPETFSYTTAEAMAMDLPVACFNLGAPAERVRKYVKGLVVSRIDAATALEEIKSFVEKLRNADCVLCR